MGKPITTKGPERSLCGPHELPDSVDSGRDVDSEPGKRTLPAPLSISNSGISSWGGDTVSTCASLKKCVVGRETSAGHIGLTLPSNALGGRGAVT